MIDILDPNFPAALAAARQMEHMTQKELGDILGVRPETISRWERGLFLPNARQLQKLDTVFFMGIDDLLNAPD